MQFHHWIRQITILWNSVIHTLYRSRYRLLRLCCKVLIHLSKFISRVLLHRSLISLNLLQLSQQLIDLFVGFFFLLNARFSVLFWLLSKKAKLFTRSWCGRVTSRRKRVLIYHHLWPRSLQKYHGGDHHWFARWIFCFARLGSIFVLRIVIVIGFAVSSLSLHCFKLWDP